MGWATAAEKAAERAIAHTLPAPRNSGPRFATFLFTLLALALALWAGSAAPHLVIPAVDGSSVPGLAQAQRLHSASRALPIAARVMWASAGRI